ncbi:RING-type domain-containing protein [Entamoeba marina]
MKLTLLFGSIFLISLYQTLQSHQPLAILLQPTFSVFVSILSLLLLLVRLFYYLLPPITHAEFTRIAQEATSVFLDLFLITHNLTTTYYKPILTFLVIDLLKVLDTSIALKSKLAHKRALPPRQIIRLLAADFLFFVFTAALLRGTLKVRGGLANTLWYELLFYTLRTPLHFLFISKTFYPITDLLADVLKVIVYARATVFFFFALDVVILRSFLLVIFALMSVIRKIRTWRAQRLLTSIEPVVLDAPETCVICQNSVDVAVRLPCKHTFHKECISDWLARSSRCPICQRDFRRVSSTEISDDVMFNNWRFREF